jgi:hypothetical protein
MVMRALRRSQVALKRGHVEAENSVLTGPDRHGHMKSVVRAHLGLPLLCLRQEVPKRYPSLPRTRIPLHEP